MSAKGTPATALLIRTRIAHRVLEYAAPVRAGRDRTERPNYGIEAAEALGVARERVFKTLVVSVDRAQLAVAVVPVSADLDPKQFAETLGGRRAELADPAAAERATGYVVGGISPLGQRRRLPTIIDASALDHDTIVVSAGRRGLQLELGAGDLASVLGAQLARIARYDADDTKSESSH